MQTNKAIIQETADILINIPIFSELSTNQVEILAKYWQKTHVKKNEIIFEEGDRGNAIYYLLNGSLVIYKDTGSAIPIEITTVKSGHFFGEIAVIEDSFRSASVQAAKNSTLLSMQKEDFDMLLQKSPEIGIVVLKGLAKIVSMQLRNTTGQFVAIQHTG